MITTRPAYLYRLEPPDFRAVAERGCFVYVYLRTVTGTPYYVGVASVWHRPLKRHTTVIPKDRARIRVLRSGLTWEEACAWEMLYIARWGRKDLGTGTLHNRTDGGEGLKGLIRTAEHRAKISAAKQGQCHTPEAKAKMSAASKGRTATPETRAKLSAIRKGKSHTPEHRAKIAAANKGKTRTPEQRARMSAAAKGRTAHNKGKTAIPGELLERSHCYVYR